MEAGLRRARADAREVRLPGHTIYRDPDNPNDITHPHVLGVTRGREQFIQDPSLQEAMEKGGVISEPRVTLLEEAETQLVRGQARGVHRRPVRTAERGGAARLRRPRRPSSLSGAHLTTSLPTAALTDL